MFGLLRHRKGCSQNEAWKRWRLHYCGTCKTMGKTYGQASRLLLNHDTVYLAEVLTSLDRTATEWNPAFRSFNCFTLPDESPAALRFSAAATVALAEYKLRDRVEDSVSVRRRVWSTARRWWNPRFRRAVTELRSLGFDTEELDRALTGQQRIERDGQLSLKAVARPTARAVAMFFSRGSVIVGRPELQDQMGEFGSTLGTLVYLLDAFEDQSRDAQTGEFNAFTAMGMTRQQALAAIDERSDQAIALMHEINPALGAAFASRLRGNLNPRLGRTLQIAPQCCAKAPDSKLSWRSRWTQAWDRAEELAEGRAWPVLAAVAVSIFAFPEHAGAADSADECMSLSANLMALGSVVAVAIGRKKKAAAAAAGAAATGVAATSGSTGGCCGWEICTCCEACEICECCGECDACGSCCECGSCCDC